MNSNTNESESPQSLLIANRGEIAVRIARAATDLGLRTVSVYSEDDSACLHTKVTDESKSLQGSGPGAYLDLDQILAAADAAKCALIHPGYGFLSENAVFARRCAEAGIKFVGPRADTIEFFGDKGKARTFAEKCDVPIMAGISTPVTIDEAREFFASLNPADSIMIKAIGGGGGRGMRLVHNSSELDSNYDQCVSEAMAVCGLGDVYVEQFLPHARHIEIQVVGDEAGNISHIWDRDCSIQRRHQKLVEVAPSPNLSGKLRERIIDAALRMAMESEYSSLGTFEFLVDADSASKDDGTFAFIEVNPRLQVEHTVTEAVTGIDLVQAQIRIASGASLAEVGLDQDSVPEPDGYALQARINMETLASDGTVRPSSGTLDVFNPPSDSGLRIDTLGYANYEVSPRFDSLLAKLIGHAPTFARTAEQTRKGLGDFGIEGVSTSIPLLQKLLEHPKFIEYRVSTSFIDEHIAELTEPNGRPGSTADQDETRATAGADIDAVDPLAVLDHGKADLATAVPSTASNDETEEPGTISVRSPMQGTVVQIDIAEGDIVHAGQQLLVLEAMKMQHLVTTDCGGIVRRLNVKLNDTIYEDHALVFIEEADVGEGNIAGDEVIDLEYIRPDLAEVHERIALGLDEARPEAVAKRRKTGHRTARENIDDLCDPESFIEYGSLVIAAQRSRRDIDDLIRNTPADGMVTGIGRVNGDLFDESKSRCAVLSYDYI
ncbi:MAG TPA: biotin/lipoyl-binding protein, partial [Candidatus Hydrogenedentes bacterium]|nr:biotin/lipoyl-binding protein [Candidatus Hydrogenedentota bacterium]